MACSSVCIYNKQLFVRQIKLQGIFLKTSYFLPNLEIYKDVKTPNIGIYLFFTHFIMIKPKPSVTNLSLLLYEYGKISFSDSNSSNEFQ